MKVIFLHIPKTAGQSCYAFLEQCFAENEICPARENYHLVGQPISALKSFRAFRGHLDWSLLDCVGEAFTFTILREPRERLLSFYFFLRLAASRLAPEDLAATHNRGLSAAWNEDPDTFFCGGDPAVRAFHDNLFDNIYTHYFAGRSFDAREGIVDVLARSDLGVTMNGILDCALKNLQSLSGAYRVSDLDVLQRDLSNVGIRPRDGARLADIVANVGVGDLSTRLDELRSLGATSATFDRIEQMVEFDLKIWRRNDIFRTW